MHKTEFLARLYGELMTACNALGFRIFEGAEQGAVGVAGGVAAGLMA